jgi:hypothetical protein
VQRTTGRRCVRILPVAEANAVMAGPSTEVEHDAEDDEADDCRDFDQREPEFRFSVVPHAAAGKREQMSDRVEVEKTPVLTS